MAAFNNTDNLVADQLLRMQLMNTRKARHLTQKQVSDMSGLSVSTISNLENGELTSTSLRSIIAYATALGLEIFIKEK